RGQVWRLLTGHFVHFGTGHLAVNLAAFAIILGWAWRSGRLGSSLLLLLAGCPVLGLLLLLSGADWYAGLSGILHGMLVLLIMRLPIGLRVAGLAVVLVKLLWQFNTGGESNFLDPALPVSQASHWFGVALGVVFHYLESAARVRLTGT
ncbi:MAG: rhombosortase, partial [Xanthomonadales bacterium]|nr:rhombosortase [Xanthomonadales bacterium]NIX12464.1 rhombosortase [Xanthomonadales bacterium]